MERILRVRGVDLCVETFGDQDDAAILLIGGAAASMDWWHEELCARLAAGSRFVIRYDHRDTGRSVTYPPGKPEYTGDDLTGDALGVLDALGVDRAHVVGISAGGGIAQEIALDHPERVASLTLLSTTAGAGDPDLPPVTAELRAHFEAAGDPDWSDRDAAVAYLVEDQRAYMAEPFDEAAVRAVAERVVDRSTDPAAAGNHHLAEGSGGSWRGRLPTLRVPTLVVHGTEDPLFPYEHGVALAAEIPGAQLLTLPEVGHEVPPPRTWDVFVPALLRHTEGRWAPLANTLAAAALAAGEPTGWFEPLYAAGEAGAVSMPWDSGKPTRMLVDWTRENVGAAEPGRRALVVGSATGEDAEHLAGLGYRTLGFDIAPTAVRVASARHPRSAVEYVVADLLDPPAEWRRGFDLVYERQTTQSLPDALRPRAIANVAAMVRPGGTLLVVAAVRDDDDPDDTGPPWPLTRREIDSYADGGLAPVRIEAFADPDQPAVRRWRAEFRRPAE